MDLQFIAQINAKGANTETKFLPEGRFGGLYIELTGTTDTGETLTLDDIGSLEVYQNDVQRVIGTFEFFNRYADLKGGFPYKPSGTAATAETVAFFVPFFKTGYPNTMQLQGQRQAYIKVNFLSALDTRFGANPATCKVWGVKTPDIPQRYYLNIKGQNVAAAGAGRISEQLAARNLVSVFLKDPDDVTSSVQLTVDDRTVTDNIDFTALKGITNLENRIESAGQPWVELELAESGIRESTLNGSSKLEPQFSGAGTLVANLFTIEWISPAAEQANIAAVRGFLNNNAQRSR